MAQTKRSTRRTPPPPAQEDDTDTMPTVLDPDADLSHLVGHFPEARRVSVRRMSQDNRWSYVGALPVDVFNEEKVQQKFGGGMYQFAIHGGDGRLLKTITNIEIADLPEDERPARPPAAVALAAAPTELSLLREQLAQNQAMLLEFIRSTRHAAPAQSNITELVTALATLKGMEPKHERQPEIQELVMKSFEHGLALAQKIQGRGPESGGPLSDLLGFAREIFQDARPLIQSALKKQMPAANPPETVAAGATLPAPGEAVEDEMEENLEPALAFVKDQLAAGFLPQSLADVVLMQMRANQELNETVSALVTEQPIEMFIEIDPELGAEPLKAKFAEFLEVMRARILAARNIGRTSGDTANA